MEEAPKHPDPEHWYRYFRQLSEFYRSERPPTPHHALCELYRVAVINPEFSFSFSDMTHHSWKTHDFIELKTGWQINILRINSYNKTAFSSDDSLDPGPEPPAGLRHGVPGEGPHHLPDLWDQDLGLVMKLCSDPQFRDATRKIVQTAAFSGAGRSDLLLPHLYEVLLEPILRLLAVVDRGACALCEGLFVFQSLCCSHKLPLSADPPEAINLIKLPCIIVNCLHSIIPSTSGAKSRDYSGSCSSLLIHLCRKCLFLFVSVSDPYSFFPDPDPDPDARALMTKNWKKNISWKKKLNFFLIKNCNLPIPRPP